MARPPSKEPWEFVRPDATHFYKYGSNLQWLEDVLLRHRVYFPSPRELDDPKDARPTLIAPSRELVVEFLRKDFVRRHQSRRRRWLDREIALMEFRLARFSKARLLEMLQEAFHEEANKNRIYSMSLRDDIEDLWQRYGGGHAGYCLEFANEGLFRQAFLVNYGDVFLFDVTAPNAATAHHFYRKTTIWSVQQEVRIVTFPRGADALQPFDSKLLRRIILGRLMPEQARVRLRALASRRSPPLEVVEH